MEEFRQQTEKALRLVKSGNTEGIDLLYYSIGGRMLSVAVGVVKNRATAEDVVQESFIKIVNNIDSYTLGTNGYAWVLKIVRNTALNRLKYEGYRLAEDIDDYYNISSSEDSIEQTENSVIIKQLMSGLPTHLRQVIYFKYFMDMPVREIAKELGISKSLAHNRIKQAEEMLKSNLKHN